MQFTESLKKNFQFRHVYQKGKSIANRHLVLYMVKNGTHDHNRLGISVSKKVGKSVVRSPCDTPDSGKLPQHGGGSEVRL